jgi:cell division protein FtsQ
MRKSQIIIRIVLVLAVIAGIMYGAYWFLETYRIDPDKIYVDGNKHYTSEEIIDLVMTGPLGDNSLYLSRKYRDAKITGVPFVDSITVQVLSDDSIRISVNEKALAGYVRYLDHYIYFNKDGEVVESSLVKTVGIPQVTGITFSHMVVGEKLSEEDDELFRRTLSITKLLNKYDLAAERIHFHDSGEITLYFGNVRVSLGNESAHLEDKVMNLVSEVPGENATMLQILEGRSGVLDMAEYSETGTYIFKPDID